MMQVRKGDKSCRIVVDDIELSRMHSDDDGDQPKQAPVIAAANQYATINYGYRTRDEISNAILKLSGKDKHAKYVASIQQHRPKLQNYASAVIADVSHSHSMRSRNVTEQEYSTDPLTPAVGMSVPGSATYVKESEQVVAAYMQRHSVTFNPKTLDGISVISCGSKYDEAGEQVVNGDVQVDSARYEQKKTKPSYSTNPVSKNEESAGLFKRLFACGICTTEAQFPDFGAFEEVKEYTAEGVANIVQDLNIDTSRPLAHVHDAPSNIVHPSASVGGCSTKSDSIIVKSNISDDRGYDCKDLLVQKTSSAQIPSHEQMSADEYESLGLGRSKSSQTLYSTSKSTFLSLMSIEEKRSSMMQSSSQTSSQDLSLASCENDSTFSSASEEEDDDDDSSSEEESDYTTPTDRSSNVSSFEPSVSLGSTESMQLGDSSSGSYEVVAYYY